MTNDEVENVNTFDWIYEK